MKSAGLIFVFVFSVISINMQNGYSQGCSDAGFCSTGSLQAYGTVDSSGANRVAMKLIFGLGEQHVLIWQMVPEAEINFNQKISFQIAIPYLFTDGDLGNTNGIGDMITSVTYKIPLNTKSIFSLTAGTRIPTGKTNLEYSSGYDFPMPYQTGLGTWDLILGASYRVQKWNFAAGYQKILKQNNRNSYLHNILILNNSEANDYFESANLKRGDDVLLRVGRKMQVGKIEITPGVLGLYRLQQDKITNRAAMQVNVQDSDGLTINLTLNAGYDFNKRFTFIAEAGAPVVVRESRPDGLTRSLVLSAALNYKF